MVDYYGRWTPEESYNNYPDSKMCDCDRLAKRIMESGYEVKTTMQNLVEMIFAYFDNPDMESEGYDRQDISECFRYVEESGGFAEFDYYG